MNTAEKVAGLYLRLNGFFLMPQFTTFGAGAKWSDPARWHPSHDHTDILGLRPAWSREDNRHITAHTGGKVIVFPVDADLFRRFEEVGVLKDSRCLDAQIAVVCEVRANEQGQLPSEDRCAYCKGIFGPVKAVPMLMDMDTGDSISVRGDGIHIGLTRALAWIRYRVRWLDANCKGMKTASWAWSDEFLSDLMLLGRFGFDSNPPEYEPLFPERCPSKAGINTRGLVRAAKEKRPE